MSDRDTNPKGEIIRTTIQGCQDRSLKLDSVPNLGRIRLMFRGRDAGYPAPPAQIPASGTTALGSYLGC